MAGDTAVTKKNREGVVDTEASIFCFDLLTHMSRLFYDMMKSRLILFTVSDMADWLDK